MVVSVDPEQSEGSRKSMPHVYIMTNQRHTVLYTGSSGVLKKRVWQHKSQYKKSFTQRYNVDKLVYMKALATVTAARIEERRIKGLLRRKKIFLIESMNPEWKDLSDVL